MELLLSPIINTLPTDGDKSAAMSLLHATFSIGEFFVVLITTLFIYLAGYKYWPIITCFWSLFALASAILFTQVPLLPPIAEDGSGIGLCEVLKRPKYILYLFQIAFGAATECNFSTWISAFLEAGLHINKLLGDALGLCIFAITHGTMRIILGKFGDRLPLKGVLLGSTFGAFLCYEVLGISPWNVLNVIACGVAGLCVSLIWPGSLIQASETYPKAGASMFALMAGAGDLGAAVGGYLMGLIADTVEDSDNLIDLADKLGLTREELGLRSSFVISGIYPIITIIMMILTGYCVKETKYTDKDIELTDVTTNSSNIEIKVEDKKDEEVTTQEKNDCVNPDDIKVEEVKPSNDESNKVEEKIEISVEK